MQHERTNPGTAATASRPEEMLIVAEARLQTPVEEIIWRVRVSPNVDFTELSVPQRIEGALAHNRQLLNSLPSEAVVDGLGKVARKALAITTPSIIEREAATLIGSFPNAAIGEPEVYLASLIFDLHDLKIPDSVVVLACRKLRRSRRFVPAISEVLDACNDVLERWKAVENLGDELRAIRPVIEEAVARAEKTLAFVQGEIADGYRDAGGRIIRCRIACEVKA